MIFNPGIGGGDGLSVMASGQVDISTTAADIETEKQAKIVFFGIQAGGLSPNSTRNQQAFCIVGTPSGLAWANDSVYITAAIQNGHVYLYKSSSSLASVTVNYLVLG